MNVLTCTRINLSQSDYSVLYDLAFLIRLNLILETADARECIRFHRVLYRESELPVWDAAMLVKNRVRGIVKMFRLAEAMGDEQDLRESKTYLEELAKMREALHV